MSEMLPASDGHLTLEEVVRLRGVTPQDCRGCANFSPAPGGMGYGTCRAHRVLVKLSRSPEPWFSQCQFKALRLERPAKPA